MEQVDGINQLQKVTMALSTHSEGGIAQNAFTLATRIDAAYQVGP